ncbi:MAG: alpha/beta hydrolase [Lawsonibacter sp.]|nr:alpha/beta hydrolase [Lawsonibacter sp.]
MIHQWDITIPELTGDEPRRAYVYLPDQWEKDQSQRYPVLYMFDGHNVFFDEDATYGKSWGMKEYLEYTGTPLIVAAVECNHSPDNGRLSEYSPYNFRYERFKQIPGRGQVTMEWFTKTFKPEIDREFPTLPGREDTFIAGSSMGGLMSLYALLEYNHIFSRAAALSPSLWVAPGKIESLIRSACLAPGTVLYMDYGSEELANHSHMIRSLGKAAQLLLEKGIFLDFRIVPGGDHSEASWERQIPFFLNTLLYGRE